MSSSSEAPSSIHGPRSEAAFPFARGPAPTERDATVLSQPRSSEGGSSNSAPGRISLPEASLAPPSPTSMKLFPTQRVPDREESIIGERLGHFIIRGRLGAGGMGTVFLADDEMLQRQVALKVLSPQQTSDPASVQRFLNEARSAARLDHDHVARVFFYGDDQGLHYIAYEYVQGNNLRDLIRSRGRLEPAEVINYAVQLAAALCHISASGVVHRDIKPSNIIVTQQGKAKLVDLGLARKESLEESAQLTVAGTTLGTFDYISPEQAKDPRNVDVRSDIYSLGCTLYHALTGEPPFPEGTVLQRLLHHHDKDPPDPALKNRRVSPAVSAVVRKMMASDPKRRYPSAEALLHDLLLIAGAMGLKTQADDHATLSALRDRGSSWWSQNANWAIAAVSLLVAATVWQVFPGILSGSPDNEALVTGPLAPADRPTSPLSEGSTENLPWDVPAVSRTNSVPTPAGTAVLPNETRPPSSVSPSERPETTLPGSGSLTGVQDLTGGRSPGGEAMIGPNLPPPEGILFRPAETPFISTTTLESAPDRSGSSSATIVGIPGIPNPLTGAAAMNAASGNPVSPLPTTESPAAGTGAKPGDVSQMPVRSPDRTPPVPALPTSDAPYINATTGKAYVSLEAACADVRDQGVIELHFDGRRPVPERPLRLVGKQISIQAASGRRPVLWYAPRDSTTDPLQSRMLVISGGSLSLTNVALELQVSQPAAVDRWALFRMERPERLKLDNVFLTIQNPAHVAAAFVESAAPPTMIGKMGAMKDSQTQPGSELRLERTVLRGEAAGVWLGDALPVRVELQNSFVAIGEWFVNCELANDAMPQNMRLTLDLRNNTLLLGQGMLRTLRTDDVSGRLLPITILARSNLVSCGPGAALVEQLFTQESMELRRPVFEWTSDRNYFDALESFWHVRFDSPLDEDRWNFDAWRNRWGSSEVGSQTNQPMSWTPNWRNREWSQISPAAVRADLQSTALATGTPLNEPDAGVPWDLLPAEPPLATPR